MRAVYLILLLVMCPCPGQDLGVRAREFQVARVTVFCSTTFGEPVGRVQVVMRAVGPEHEYRKLGDAIRFDEIPFGAYDIEVERSGFDVHRERVGIYQREVDLFIGLVVAPLHSAEPSEILGRVQAPRKLEANYWARLVPWYSGELLEDRVHSDGTFRFSSVSPGRYVVLIFGNEGLLAAKPIEYFGGKLLLNFPKNDPKPN